MQNFQKIYKMQDCAMFVLCFGEQFKLFTKIYHFSAAVRFNISEQN
jgi:hypothetical protein